MSRIRSAELTKPTGMRSKAALETKDTRRRGQKTKRSIFQRIVSPDPVRCRIAYGYVWSLDRRLIVSRVAWQDPLSKLDIRTVGCLARFPLLSTLQILPHLPSLRFPCLSISRCDPDTDSSCFAGKFWRFSVLSSSVSSETRRSRRDVTFPSRG